jgi:hypothetical protein
MCTAVMWWVLTESVGDVYSSCVVSLGDVFSVWCSARNWDGGINSTWVQQVCIYRVLKKNLQTSRVFSAHCNQQNVPRQRTSANQCLLTCEWFSCYLCVPAKDVNTTFSSPSINKCQRFKIFVVLFESPNRHSLFLAVNTSISWIGS